MPRHWIAALAVVLAVAAGVTAYALASDGDESPTVTAAPTSSGTTVVRSAPRPATTATASSAPGAGATAATTAGSTATTAASTTGAPCPPAAGGAAPFDAGLGTDTLLLTAVEVTSPAACTAQVIFRFRSSTASPPGVAVSYQQPPFVEDPSGRPVSVAGSAFLVVRFEPAGIFDFATGEVTYDEPQPVVPAGTFAVQELRLTGAFEGVVTWLVGLDGERPFTVTTGPDVATITIT